MGKVIKIILNDNEVGSYNRDKIIMVLSPSIVEDIYSTYKEKALKENKDYLAQGVNRKIANLFYDAFSDWERERSKAKFSEWERENEKIGKQNDIIRKRN